jgi:hypothetical protein
MCFPPDDLKNKEESTFQGYILLARECRKASGSRRADFEVMF